MSATAGRPRPRKAMQGTRHLPSSHVSEGHRLREGGSWQRAGNRQGRLSLMQRRRCAPTGPRLPRPEARPREPAGCWFSHRLHPVEAPPSTSATAWYSTGRSRPRARGPPSPKSDACFVYGRVSPRTGADAIGVDIDAPGANIPVGGIRGAVASVGCPRPVEAQREACGSPPAAAGPARNSPRRRGLDCIGMPDRPVATQRMIPSNLPNPSDPYQHSGWTPRRQQVHDRLAGKAPPLAGLYASAVFLLHHPTWPGRHYLLGHAVREIGQRLPDFLDPRRRARAEADAALQAFAAAWSGAGLPITETQGAAAAASSSLQEGDDSTLAAPSGPSNPESLVIPTDVAQAASKLVGAHQKGSTNNYRKAASIILASPVPDRMTTAEEATPGDARDATVLLWTKTVDWFMDFTHVSATRKVLPPEEELARRFDIVENIIEAILAPWYEVLDDLDDALATANTPVASSPATSQPAGTRSDVPSSPTDQDELPAKDEPR